MLKPGESSLVVYLPSRYYNAFKALCAVKGITVKSVITEFIKLYVEDVNIEEEIKKVSLEKRSRKK